MQLQLHAKISRNKYPQRPRTATVGTKRYRKEPFAGLATVSFPRAAAATPGCTTQAPPPPPVVVAAPAPTPTPIPDPYASLPSYVAEAIKHNQTPTLQHGITTVWPYSADRVYPLNCAALHVTQIRLRDDETTDKDNVKVGDKDRWGTIVGDHTVLIFPLGSTTSITVPGAQVRIPADPNMKTNLVI